MSSCPTNIIHKPPHVLISGAGLAGLFLGILLERAGIPFDIYERATEIKPLGAIMHLLPNILAAFDQLGLYEQLLSFSKLGGGLATFYTDKLQVIATSTSSHADIVGYDPVFFARPELYDMLYKMIPSNKIHMKKKLTSFDQDKEGVKVYFEDGSIAEGDILVGADGAHSTVRQHLYKTLEQEGLLPESDTKEMNKGYISLVGTTGPLDPSKYPCLSDPKCEVSFVIGDKSTPFTWVLFSVPGNKMCWNVIIQLGLSSTADEKAESLDWEQQDNQEMMNEIRHFKTPYGLLGDLFDATPAERVSKVYYEDMLFETWNHGRAVLIGDAAHKLLPSSGAGAVNAMQDAVLLANHIYDVFPTSHENVKAALSGYKDERFDTIKDQYPQSYISAKLMYGHTLSERILRYVLFNWMPKSVQKNQLIRDSAYRPQANFLPQAPKRGTLDVIPQRPSSRIQKEDEKAKDQMAIPL